MEYLTFNMLKKSATDHFLGKPGVFGLRLSVFAVAVAIYDGLMAVSESLDHIANNVEVPR